MKQEAIKKILIVVCLLTGIQFASFAQSKEVRVSPLRFAGVHPLSSSHHESDAFLVMHSGGSGVWNYEMFNTSLEEIKSGTIETPSYSFFNGVTYNGSHAMVSFVVNALSTSVTYVVLDDKGNEVSRETRDDVPNLRRGDQFFPEVFPHPEKGFIIVQSAGRARNAGYVIEHVDHKMNRLWKMDFESQRGSVHVYDLLCSGDFLYILEASERLGKTTSARVHGVDLLNGIKMYTMELQDDEYSYFPTALNINEDKTISMAGTYFRGNRISGRNTRGLFFLTVANDGSTAGMSVHPWQELRPTLRTSVPDWFFKVMPDVYIHAIEANHNGTFTAIAELYRYSGEVRQEDSRGRQEQYHRIRMLDFMVFNFDNEGQILYTERIERPHMVLKLDSEFSGGPSSLAYNAGQGPLMRARAMKKAGAFTYRFHHLTENSLQLAFMSYENKMHYAYLMDVRNNQKAIKVDMQHAKPSFISYMQIIDLCANQSGFGFILTEMNTRSFDDSEAYWRGLLPVNGNKMLIYEYMPLGGRLKFDIISSHQTSL